MCKIALLIINIIDGTRTSASDRRRARWAAKDILHH